MKRLLYVLTPLLFALPACGQGMPQPHSPVPSGKVAAMVDSLYKEVVARHPLGTPDRKVFGPYLSTQLLRGLDADDACLARWQRANPDPNLKPPIALLELGVFSGGADDTEPQTFQIETVEPGKDDSYRVQVNLTRGEEADKQTWNVAAVVVLENGRPVVNDILYLRQDDRDETRLSDLIALDCRAELK